MRPRGGVVTSVVVFTSAACVVGLISWLLLQHVIFKIPKNDTSSDEYVEPISEGNKKGDIIMKSIVLPEIPAPEAPPAPLQDIKGIQAES